MALDDERETIMTSSGGLLRVARIEAPDLETASPEALVALHERLGGRVRPARHRLQRVARPVAHGGARATCPRADFGGCLAARLVDDSRERQFTDAARPVFSNSAFIALHYVPQPRDAVLAFLMERDGPLVDANVSHFRETSEAMLPRGRAGPCGRSRCCAATTSSSYLFANVTFRPGPASFPTGAAGAAAGVRGVAHVAVALDRRPARRDGRGALVRLAHAADVRGPARGARSSAAG